MRQAIICRLVFLSLIFCLPSFAADSEVVEQSICENRFLLRGSTRVSFTGTETKLICGDADSEVWANIPDNQAMFHLKTFLEDRAFFRTVVERQGDRLVIELGPQSRVTHWSVEGVPPDFGADKMRHIVGELLTPALLDQVKDRITLRLLSQGFACPEVSARADFLNGDLRILAQTGPKKTIIKINEQPVPGMNAQILRRYDAFEMDGPFNNDYLTVTVNRILSDTVLQNTHFLAQCTPEGVVLEQKNIAGPPRLLTLGVGLNTERWLTAQVSWRHLRLGDTASRFSVSALGSFTYQELTADLEWYYHSYPSRQKFHPTLSFHHEDVSAYNNLVGDLSLTPETSWDGEDAGLKFLLGPDLNYVHTIRGDGPRDAKFMAVKAQVILQSHYYEFNANSPETGYRFELMGLGSYDKALSDVTAQMAKFSFEKLWNVRNLDPAWLVIGFRGAYTTTITQEDPVTSSVLPVTFRQFLGGSGDVRGFSLTELPGGVEKNYGALTSLFSSLELRWPDLLFWGLQPLVFTDIGVLGRKDFTLDYPIYWAPGLGLRLQSQIGVFRTTLAHGYVEGDSDNTLSHWQFYLSYGEEF